jgi:hypothetical protein
MGEIEIARDPMHAGDPAVAEPSAKAGSPLSPGRSAKCAKTALDSFSAVLYLIYTLIN